MWPLGKHFGRTVLPYPRNGEIMVIQTLKRNGGVKWQERIKKMENPSMNN